MTDTIEIGQHLYEWHYGDFIFCPIFNLICTSHLKEMENITVLLYITDPLIA